MRIEINTGFAGCTVHQLTKALNSLENKIDDVVDSFQAVRKKVSKVRGGVGKLSGALSALDRRIAIEKQKKNDAKEFGNKCESFIKLAINRDNKVENMVNRNRLESYFKDFKLSKLGALLGDCVSVFLDKIGLSFISDAVSSTIKFVVDSIVEWGDEVFAGVVIGFTIAFGIACVIASGGSALILILGFAAIGFGVGGLIAGTKSMQGDDDIDLLETLKGAIIGAICGAAIGACMAGGAALGSALKAGATLGKAAKVGLTLAKLGTEAGTAMFFDVFTQTVVNSDSVGFENYNIWDTLFAGATAFAISGLTLSLGKFTPLGKLGKLVEGGISSRLSKLSPFWQSFISTLPTTFVTSIFKTSVETGVKKATNRLDEDYGWDDFNKDLQISLALDIFSSAVESKMEVDKPTKTDKLSPVIDDPTPGKAAGMDDVNPSEFKKVTVDGDVDVNTNKMKFDKTADGLTYKQPVPENIDKSFSAFSAEVKSLDSSTNYFSSDFSNIERGMTFKDALGGDNIKVRSIDLDADMYVKDGNLFSSLNKQLSGMDAGDTLKIVLENKSLRAGHIGELNSIFDIAKDMNISMEIHSMVLSLGR